MSDKVIACLGTGIMGRGVIKNLRKQGFKLRIYNRTRPTAEQVIVDGDVLCETPAEAAHGAGVIISCVLDDPASWDVWFGENGAAQAAAQGTICIEMATLSVGHIDQWSRKLIQLGLKPIDSPATGSRKGAETGTLTLFIGGKHATIQALQPIFTAVASQQFHIGKEGSGARFKLVYNTLGGTILIAMAESLGLAKKLGLDLDMVVRNLSESNYSWGAVAMKAKGSQMIHGKHSEVWGKLDIIQKDFTYIMESSSRTGVELPAAQAVHTVLTRAQQRKLGKLDMSAVADMYINKPKENS